MRDWRRRWKKGESRHEHSPRARRRCSSGILRRRSAQRRRRFVQRRRARESACAPCTSRSPRLDRPSIGCIPSEVLVSFFLSISIYISGWRSHWIDRRELNLVTGGEVMEEPVRWPKARIGECLQTWRFLIAL